jgi:hypothetical protein
MRVRALRQAGLAVVPMVLLSQCAPQCTPAPPPPSPPAMASYDLTGSLPADVFTADITPDGRYVGYMGSGTHRLDMHTWYSEETDDGLLIGDGWGVVDYWSDTSVALYDFTTGTALTRAELPAGWELAGIDSTSRDGRRVGVTAFNAALNDVAAFLLDLQVGWATRLDQPFPDGSSPATASYGALVSADGQTAAYSYRDGPYGCTACVDTWAFRSGGHTLVSPTPGGTTSMTGDSEPVDVSSDGRFILFHSTATDLAGGVGTRSLQGHLFVGDLLAGTTTVIPELGALGDAFASAISDDGTKVVLPVDRVAGIGPRPFAAVHDRNNGLTTVLTPVDLDHQLSIQSWLAMTANGGRIAFDVHTNSGDVRHVVVDLSY